MLKLKHDEPLSNFAFNFNLRCYTEDQFTFLHGLQKALNKVGRCSLTL